MAVDYSKMDSWIQVPTWHTRHALDVRRFNKQLELIVDDVDFHADDMGAYLRATHNISFGSTYSDDLDRYVADAWAVKEFLNASGR